MKYFSHSNWNQLHDDGIAFLDTAEIENILPR